MKQQDIAIVILIVAISATFSFFISNSFISPPDKTEEAAVVAPIQPEFIEPARDYFNEDSVNPTQIIRIQESKNQDPFQ